MDSNLASAKRDDSEMRPLDTAELDQVAGGFLWIPVVVVSFAAGVAIRAGIDKIVEKITGD